MNFVSLQENLRRELRKRVDAGELTGMELARRTGFTQAHISNFLNRKRGLKLSALDRMLKSIGLTLYDLLNPHDLVRFAAAPAGSDTDYAEIPLVAPRVAAAGGVIVNEEVEELFKVRRATLSRLRADLVTPARRNWTRFLLIMLDAREGRSLWPRLGPNSLLLLDRHYNSLRAYHKSERNLYAVRMSGGCAVRYVEPGDRMLILRPQNPEVSVEILPVPEGHTPNEMLVGRVAHAASEL